jgi:hypothetical protein
MYITKYSINNKILFQYGRTSNTKTRILYLQSKQNSEIFFLSGGRTYLGRLPIVQYQTVQFIYL